MKDIDDSEVHKMKSQLAAAQQKIAEMQNSAMGLESLRIQNQKLMEELTMSQNHERAAKEKAEHIEKDLKKVELKLQKYESESADFQSRDDSMAGS